MMETSNFVLTFIIYLGVATLCILGIALIWTITKLAILGKIIQQDRKQSAIDLSQMKNHRGNKNED